MSALTISSEGRTGRSRSQRTIFFFFFLAFHSFLRRQTEIAQEKGDGASERV